MLIAGNGERESAIPAHAEIQTATRGADRYGLDGCVGHTLGASVPFFSPEPVSQRRGRANRIR